jgi:RNA polymerase sigma factor (sigma-70 family)
MNTVQQLLEDTLANGELDQQLAAQHWRWRHLWDFAEFREAVLARAWDRREQFRGQTTEEFLAWLRRLGWSVAVDRWRARRREAGLLQRLASLLPRFTRSAADAVETRDLVEWLLAGLTERERKLLILKYYQQLSTEQIARSLGTSTAAIHQLHYRVLGKLRARIKKSGGGR